MIIPIKICICIDKEMRTFKLDRSSSESKHKLLYKKLQIVSSILAKYRLLPNVTGE